DGLPSKQIYNLESDNQSGLWVASQNGISRMEWDRPHTIFDESRGLEGIVSNLVRHKGRTYVANSYGLFVLAKDKEGEFGFKPVDGLDMRVWDLVSAGKDLIVGTADGVFMFNDGGVKQINEIITTILSRSLLDPNRIYIGHPRGLSTIYRQEGTWINEGDAAHIDQDLLTIAETSSGDLWLGARPHGVVYLRADSDGGWGQNNRPEIYSGEHGVPPGYSKAYVIDDTVVLRADCELNETCFFYFQKDQNKFVPDDGFAKTFAVKEGSYLYRHQKEENHILLREPDHETLISAFQLPTGDYQLNKILLGSLDENVNRCVYWEKGKVLWMGGEAVLRYDLTNNFKPPEAYPTYVRKVTTSNDSVIFAGLNSTLNQELSIQENALRLEFAAPFFDSNTKTQYQYQLEGFDPDWSSWSQETKKDYTNIPAGEYKFKVRARNMYKVVSDQGIYSFSILPPWYATTYAYVLYAILTIFLIWGIIKWRIWQLQKEKEALERLVAARTEEVSGQARLLEVQTEQLKELDRAKSRFFGNISHEFRTPLTLIKGPVEHIEQHADERLSRENIKMIRRNADRLLKLVNQLLDLSRIDEGELKLEPTEGDVYKCLRIAASSFNSHAAQREIDYRVRIPRQVLWASFDRDKLENVIYNLLGNAFKFSEDNSEVSIDAHYNKEELEILVTDSGKGIAKEKIPFVFDRFYQVDDSSIKEKEGSGIGLSLSKDLVELMGGSIAVLSQRDKGTKFTVLLPLQEIRTGGELSDIPNKELQKAISGGESFDLSREDKRSVPSLLLVEDNADMRHFIKEHLINEYRIKEAINGQEGLKLALASPPELVITDLMMPRMSGIELCKKLKTNVHTSHIPVIMLTAKAGQANKIEGLETGADDYITKPFDARELLVRAKNLIEQRQKLRELYANNRLQLDPKKIAVTSIDQKFLEQLLALLEDKFSDGAFGVPQIQEALAMSKSQLHRKLKALTNEAPGELLRNFRLKRAAQLLSQKADTVTQIAYRVGFNDLSYFAKCFKELYGVVPSSY
ncbi:MAG: hybrid sensor histidine kinase/response regulator transcription factor, partial [Aurantibacter sp.]